MLKVFFYFIAMLFSSGLLSAQSIEMALGGTSSEHAEEIIKSADGGYFISGESESFGFGQKDFILIKYDSSGNVVWAKSYGTSAEETGYEVNVSEISDGSIFLTGAWELNPGSQDKAIVIKLNSFGELLWSKQLVGPSGFYADGFSEVNELPDGNLCLNGYSQSVSTGNQDAIVIKMTPDGVILNSVAMGGNSPDHSQVVHVVSDGLLVQISGISFGPGSRGCGFMKLDHDLNILWYRKVGTLGSESFYDSFLKPNGNILAVGRTDQGPGEAGLLVEFNSEGEVLWSKKANLSGGVDRFIDVCYLEDGRYILTFTSSSISTLAHILVDTGNNIELAYLLSQETTFADSRSNVTIATGSNQILTAGGVSSVGNGEDDIYVSQYPMGEIPCGGQVIEMEFEDISLTEIEPSFSQTTGAEFEINEIGEDDITNSIGQTVICADEDLCVLDGEIQMPLFCVDQLGVLSFELNMPNTSELLWNWNVVGHGVFNESEVELSFSEPGDYNVSLELIDPEVENCSIQIDTIVEVNSGPDFELYSIDSICLGQPFVGSVSFPGDSLNWDNELTTADVTFELNSSGFVGVEVFENGCSSYMESWVHVSEVPSIEIVGPSQVCSGVENEYQLIPSHIGLWDNGQSSAGSIYSFSEDHILSVVVEVEVCTTELSLPVSVEYIPDVLITGDTITCQNLSEVYVATGADYFEWSTGDEGNMVEVELIADTIIYVIGQNNCGLDSQFVNIEVLSIMAVSHDTLVLNGEYSEYLQLDIFNNIDFSISNNSGIVCSPCGDYWYQIMGNEELSVQYTDQYGCSQENTLLIELNPCIELFVPNSFSPNGDGLNELFKPVCDVSCVQFYELIIYDRYGGELFRSNRPEKGWNGRGAHEESFYTANELYNWVITYSYRGSSERKSKRGFVSVIR